MRDTPWLAGLYAHGVRGRIATGPNTEKRIPLSSAKNFIRGNSCCFVNDFAGRAILSHVQS